MKNPISDSSLRQVVIEQQEEIVRFQSFSLVMREQVKELLEQIDKPWIKVIMGIRRCGKSMLGHQALKGRLYGYLNFDDERLIGLSAQDLNKMLQFILETNPQIKTLFFDEIQNVEGWELFINRLQRQGYNLLITGSNSKLLSKELATHLTGRHVCITLFPFSFREFLRAKTQELDTLNLDKTQDRALIYHYLEQYLQAGGFPEMVLGGYNGAYLRELYDKIVSRDITYRYQVKYSSTLKVIAVYSHANLGSKLSFHKVKNIFAMSSIHTVKNYFQYLEDAYLVFLLHSFSYKQKEKVRQPKKVYTIDNGLSFSINPSFSQNRGAALESLVFQELCRREKPFAYCAAGDYEIDFVLHEGRRVMSLIQVAWSLADSMTHKREIRSLINGAKDFGCKNLQIITWEEDLVEEIEGYEIKICSIVNWFKKTRLL